METTTDHNKIVNLYVNLHGSLADKQISTVPFNTNLIFPACCGNVNLIHPTQVGHISHTPTIGQEYYKDIEDNLLPALTSPHKPKIVTMYDKPYKIIYSGEQFCDIILKFPRPCDNILWGIKKFDEEVVRTQPITFNEDGFNLMRKMTIEQKFFSYIDKSCKGYGIGGGGRIFEENDLGYSINDDNGINRTFKVFIYNLHYLICKQISRFNNKKSEIEVKGIVLNEDGTLREITNDIFNHINLFNINPEIESTYINYNSTERLAFEQHDEMYNRPSDGNKHKVFGDDYGQEYVPHPKFVPTPELLPKYNITVVQNFDLLEKISSMVLDNTDMVYNIIRIFPKKVKYSGYMLYDNSMNLISSLKYTYLLACSMSRLNQLELKLFNEIQFQTYTIDGINMYGFRLSTLLEMLRTYIDDQYTINIFNESCQYSVDKDSKECIAMYCYANVLSAHQKQQILDRHLDREVIVHYLRQLKEISEWQPYFTEVFTKKQTYLSDNDLMVLNFIYNYFTKSKVPEISPIDCYHYVIWLAKQLFTKVIDVKMFNKACMYANASLILHELGIIPTKDK